MSKITKKMFDSYNKTNKQLDNSKKSHQKCVDSIKEIIKPMIAHKHQGVNWKITGIEFCYDSDIDYNKKTGDKYEWCEISEDEYYKNNQGFNQNDDYKEDYIFEPEFQIKYFRKIEKRYNYLRVYVYEWWRYGGEDSMEHDFLLSEILEPSMLRKDKLQKLMED